jgi:hypothetical protein
MSDAAAATDPNFPQNIEYLGFVGGWNCDFGIDAAEELFYLIRTNDGDWLFPRERVDAAFPLWGYILSLKTGIALRPARNLSARAVKPGYQG